MVDKHPIAKTLGTTAPWVIVGYFGVKWWPEQFWDGGFWVVMVICAVAVELPRRKR